MSKFFLPLLLTFLTLASACGKAQAGDACNAGEGTCESNSSALICDNSKLRLFNCRGTAGCIDNSAGEKDVCDFGSFRSGDACPSSIEGGFQCDPANADQVLKCSSGTMQAQACKSCALQGSNIICQ